MNAHADLVYFWAAILIVLTPLLILGTIGVLVVRQWWKDRRAHSPLDSAP